MIITTAILVDGAFYRKRAKSLFGDKSPEDRAKELHDYCLKHVHAFKGNEYNLYRIFYYDCPPINKNVFNPIIQKDEALGKSEQFEWMTEFLNKLKSKRKLALRLGRLSDAQLHYNLKYDSFKKLVKGTLSVSSLSQQDLELNIEQKGVDMRIGVDISSLSFKKQVSQIVLIAGDSDFVPAAKQARREGIDFILDPMEAHINPDLYEHIDGIRSQIKNIKTDITTG